MPNGLDQFKRFVVDFRKMPFYAIGGTGVLPFVAYMLRLAPPGFPAASPIATISEMVVLIVVFHFWSNQGRERVSRRMKIALITFCLMGICYLTLFNLMVFSTPANGEQGIRGFRLRSDVRPFLNAVTTEDDLLRKSEYEPTDVYTVGSIITAKMSLIATWIISFVSLSIFIGSFVLFQTRQNVPVARR